MDYRQKYTDLVNLIVQLYIVAYMKYWTDHSQESLIQMRAYSAALSNESSEYLKEAQAQAELVLENRKQRAR